MVIRSYHYINNQGLIFKIYFKERVFFKRLKVIDQSGVAENHQNIPPMTNPTFRNLKPISSNLTAPCTSALGMHFIPRLPSFFFFSSLLKTLDDPDDKIFSLGCPMNVVGFRNLRLLKGERRNSTLLIKTFSFSFN